MAVPPNWFTEVAEAQEPGEEELLKFVDAVLDFLNFVIEDPSAFQFLWQRQPALRPLARETFRGDVREVGGSELRNAIPRIDSQTRRSHGLSGRALRFKLKVVDSIAGMWGVAGLNIPGWLKRLIEAIDAILGSLVEAAHAGGIIKEFKDALSALIPEK